MYFLYDMSVSYPSSSNKNFDLLKKFLVNEKCISKI